MRRRRPNSHSGTCSNSYNSSYDGTAYSHNRSRNDGAYSYYRRRMMGATDWSKIGQEVTDAYTGKYKGTTVTLSHGLSGDEEAKFKATFADFEAATGIKVDLISGGTVEASQLRYKPVQKKTLSTSLSPVVWPDLPSRARLLT